MPNRKKRKVYQFKQFDNLLTSSNIFNTLKNSVRKNKFQFGNNLIRLIYLQRNKY